MQGDNPRPFNQTDSWFDLLIDEAYPAPAEPIYVGGELIRAKTARLSPNTEQRKILIKWMKLYIKIYNFGIDHLRMLIRTKCIPFNDKAFKNLAQLAMPDGLKAKQKAARLPARIRSNALLDVFKGYTSAMANFDAGNIKRFRMRYKKREMMSICISGDSFPKENLLNPERNHNAFNVSVLGDMITDISIIGVKSDCRLVLKNGTFYLYIPERIEQMFIPYRQPICSMDPGGRTFLTLWDGTKFVKICNNSYQVLTALFDRILFMKGGIPWSMAKQHNIEHFAKLEAPTGRQLARKEYLASTYPTENALALIPKVKKPKRVPVVKHSSIYRTATGARKVYKPKHSNRDKKSYYKKYRANHPRKRKNRGRAKRDPLANQREPADRVRAERSTLQKMNKFNRRIRDKIKHMIEDMHFKIALMLVRIFRRILIGDMSTQGIIKCGGNLSKSVKRQFAALSHYTFRMRLIAKAEQYQCTVHVIDEFRTSKTCSSCGELKHDLKGKKVYNCEHCSYSIDRDHNGAVNIMKVYGGCFKQTRAFAAAQILNASTTTH
jgi:transposase